MKKYFSFAMALVAMLAMVSASSGWSDDGVDYSVTIVAKTTLSLSKTLERVVWRMKFKGPINRLLSRQRRTWIGSRISTMRSRDTSSLITLQSRRGCRVSFGADSPFLYGGSRCSRYRKSGWYHDVRTYDRSEVDYGKRLCNADRSFERERDLSVRFYD